MRMGYGNGLQKWVGGIFTIIKITTFTITPTTTSITTFNNCWNPPVLKTC